MSLTDTQIAAQYCASYEALFGTTAPQIRHSDKGGFYISHPVRKQMTRSEMQRIVKFQIRLREEA